MHRHWRQPPRVTSAMPTTSWPAQKFERHQGCRWAQIERMHLWRCMPTFIPLLAHLNTRKLTHARSGLLTLTRLASTSSSRRCLRSGPAVAPLTRSRRAGASWPERRPQPAPSVLQEVASLAPRERQSMRPLATDRGGHDGSACQSASWARRYRNRSRENGRGEEMETLHVLKKEAPR